MFTLPDLPYGYNALEPYIDTETMHFHHDAHHATYVKNLNEILKDNDEFLNVNIDDLIKNLDKVPEHIRTKVRNNGGQHANHALFWTIMAPSKGGEPEGKIRNAIVRDFGDFLSFKDQFSNSAVSLFGSGWAWLVAEDGKLAVMNTPNGDSPLIEGKTPLLNLDVWEHAYYLKYKNKRKDYVDAWWNVVNWEEVERRFT